MTRRKSYKEAIPKTKLAASLGYDGLFVRDRFAEEVIRVAGERAIDAVFDPVGGAVQQRSLELLRPLGRMIPLGNASGEESGEVLSIPCKGPSGRSSPTVFFVIPLRF